MNPAPNESENTDLLNIPAQTEATSMNMDAPQTMVNPALTESSEPIMELTEDEKTMEEVEETPDFSSLNKEQLLHTASMAVKEKDLTEATTILNAIKPLLENLLEDEENKALQKFIDEGGEKDDFEYKHSSEGREAFAKIYRELKQRKSEEKAKQEAEKLSNLQRKEEILHKIKLLSEEEETKESIQQVRSLISEWKQIRNIPKEHAERLYESFKVYLDNFYDRLSQFNELKDLDRQKNLEHKIDLIKKVTQLATETSMKHALIMLKKYQEEWRSIGPVPKESNEDLWQRFKTVCDTLYEMIKAYQVEMDKKREENLLAKKDILAKALEISNFQSSRIKDWMEKSTQTSELMDAWKKVGNVPLKHREQIWNDFKKARNDFYNNKNIFFKKLHAERAANLKVKTELCEKAEAVAANPIDWNKQTEELKKLQEAWKTSGPVNEKISDAIWKRFRTACDQFFEKKQAHYSVVADEQKVNLAQKNSLIEKLENILQSEENANIIHDLKAIQEEWNKIGFVPMNAKEAINKKYNDLNDKVFARFKQASQELREMKEQAHYEALFNAPNWTMKIKQEEKFLSDKIRGLKNDIDTWENNLGFFSRSKGDNPMTEQIKSKIEQAQKSIAHFDGKLKTLRKMMKEKAAAS
jgi:hypothetical protein